MDLPVVAPERVEDLLGVHVRQAEVEDHGVERRRAPIFQRGDRPLARLHLEERVAELGALEQQPDLRAILRAVVDDEEAERARRRHHRPPLLSDPSTAPSQ